MKLQSLKDENAINFIYFPYFIHYGENIAKIFKENGFKTKYRLFFKVENRKLRIFWTGKYYQPENKELSIKDRKEYLKIIKDQVLSYFEYGSNRAFVFRYIFTMRCLNCTKLLKGRQKKFCTGDCSYYFYSQYDWRYIKDSVFKRDTFRCVKCSKTDIETRLHVDHIVEISNAKNKVERAKLFIDPSNLQLLCENCHKEKTKKYLQKKFTKKKEIKPLIIEESIKKGKLLDFIKGSEIND